VMPSPSLEGLGLRSYAPFEATSAFTCVPARWLAPPLSGGLSMGFSSFGFPPGCHPSYRASGSCPGGTISR